MKTFIQHLLLLITLSLSFNLSASYSIPESTWTASDQLVLENFDNNILKLPSQEYLTEVVTNIILPSKEWIDAPKGAVYRYNATISNTSVNWKYFKKIAPAQKFEIKVHMRYEKDQSGLLFARKWGAKLVKQK